MASGIDRRNNEQILTKLKVTATLLLGIPQKMPVRCFEIGFFFSFRTLRAEVALVAAPSPCPTFVYP